MARILLTSHQFFPRFYTGTETLVLEFADELKCLGHTVEIITVEPILPGDDIPDRPRYSLDEYSGHKIWRLYLPPANDPLSRLMQECYDTSLEDIYNEILDNFNPEIVHAFHLMRLTASFTDAVKRRGIPFFFTATDYWILCPTYQMIKADGSLCDGPTPHDCFACITNLYTKGMAKVPLHYKLAVKFPRAARFANRQAAVAQGLLNRRIRMHQRLTRQFDGLFITNEFMRNMFHKNGFFGCKEYILDFPIPKRAERARNIVPISNTGPLKVAFIGTLRSSKGPQVLINACKRIGGNRSDMEVQIWGSAEDPNFEYSLKKMASGIEWVKFCGTFPQERFPDVLENIHVVVVPSLWYENTPLTALTALGAKRLVVASDLGGLSSMVKHEENGFLFPAGDDNALAETLVQLATDRTLVTKMAAASPSPKTITEYVNTVIKCYTSTVPSLF